MTFFCPNCLHPVPPEAQTCPHCGASLAVDDRPYQAKLVAALGHPDPLTQRRAAYLLGFVGDQRAVEPLVAVLHSPADPYVRAQAAQALGALGGAQAQAALAQILQDETESILVYDAARCALGQAGQVD